MTSRKERFIKNDVELSSLFKFSIVRVNQREYVKLNSQKFNLRLIQRLKHNYISTNT